LSNGHDSAAPHRRSLEEQMLRKEQNEFITHTGPSTPMGELFRCYWTPALLTEELPDNNCPPVRVKLLSERLVAFRDSQGRYGLIDEFCAHRGASLWFGRNEECGLRCPYHGWKFDVTGQCVEVPSEPVASGCAQRIKLRSYPLIEQGGVLWTYMGPPDRAPPLPPSASSQSACRSATGCRPWKAASIPAMFHGSIAPMWFPTRCSKARRAMNTTWAT
jgi:phenylpropionate dioxygenase-like ring-hydroxylating dioxygenase large terminal subunit